MSDYSAAAKLKAELLPVSSRQIAEVHYKLCIVYDMTPGRLSYAIEHARKAEASVQARLDEVTARLQKAGKGGGEPEPDSKGKGKGKYVAEISLDGMTKEQLEGEIKELQELLEDVSLKVGSSLHSKMLITHEHTWVQIEELKTSPDLADVSAPEIVAQELDRDLNAGAASASVPKQVNDLTAIVKKKRKAPEQEPTPAVESGASTPPEKKAKMDSSFA